MVHAESHFQRRRVIHLCKSSCAYSDYDLNASKITLLRCLYDSPNNLSIALLG